MKRKILRYLPIFVFIASIIAIAFLNPLIFSTRNILNIVEQSSSIGLMAIGMTVVLIGGGIDLSIPANMALSGILGAMVMQAGINPAIATLVMLGTGSCIGIINGYLVAYKKMVPFVVTLSTMYIVMGLDIWLTKEASIPVMNFAFVDTVLKDIWFIPVPSMILAFFAIFTEIMARKSMFGQWLYAVGTDPNVSRYAGIPSDMVIFGTYVFSGFFAGMASVITTARLMSASASMGEISVVLSVIGSAVIGGVSIYGGTGNPVGAAIGALILTFISNFMNLMNVSYFIGMIVRGIIIVMVVVLDTLRRRGQEKKAS